MDLSQWGLYRPMMGSEGTRGVSSVVGVVLLLAITIVGTGVVVGIGAQAFADAERTTTISQTEHSLTQFDSQAAIVALGESSSQRVELGPSGDGEFVADDDAGWLRVVHHNATGSSENETIYNASLGSVSYRNGDTEIGYQGGGVWERRGNGSVMRSPPEFNYRGATLTLPSIRVTTDARASGRTTAIVTQADDSRRVFPNESATDGDEDWTDAGAPYGNGTAYSNPVVTGNVTVTVQSRFYEGWAEFFRTRTTGEVSVDHDREQASVRLVTIDTIGKFTLNDVISNDPLVARGQAPGHSVTDFETTVISTGGNNFKGTYSIGFHAESPEGQFETVVHVPGGTGCNGGIDDSDSLVVSMFYRNDTSGQYHEWSNTSVPATSGPIRLECSSSPGSKTATLTMDLTAGNVTTGQNLTYDVSGTDPIQFDDSGTTADTVTFSHTGEDGEPLEFGDGGNDEATTYLLTRHYFALLGTQFELTAEQRGASGGSHIDKGDSTGVFDYESGGGGTYITYLHVTENEIEVELE
jgi:flagellin-like protein